MNETERSLAVETPEADRMLEIGRSRRSPSQVLSEFVEWLDSEGISLASYVLYQDVADPVLAPIPESYSRLFARFFGVDYDRLESEKRALLDQIRENNR
jgi:hypothetical protein